MTENSGEDNLESKISNYIKKNGLSEHEAIQALRQLRTPEKKRKLYTHKWDPEYITIGILPDTHIGSKYFDQNIWDEAVNRFNEEDVHAIYHVGDIIEGMSNREGHIYEVAIPGVTAQVDKACELLAEINAPVYFLEGNHHQWAGRKADQGVEVGKMIEQGVDGVHKIGEMAADVQLAKNVKMRITHEGSTCYALSYSGQKRINAADENDKPEIWVNGHIHKALYMYYRNIHFLEAGCMQRQTPFMAMKGSPAMLGYWILDIGINKGNLAEFTPRFYPHE